jgi:uncharacterized membrane protein YeaQ/YmgE (transglycosylase-associated protein family)
VGYLISVLVSGLIIGALGRLAIPGPNPMGCLATLAVGVGGSILGGLLGAILFGSNFSDHGVAVVVFEVLGAALIVWLIEQVRRRRGVV